MKTKIDDSQILNIVRQDEENAQAYYDSYLLPKIMERIDLHNADDSYYAELMPDLHKKSKFKSTDVADTIEWIMPSMMRIFYGSQEVLTATGRTAEDEHKAKIHQKLANWQLDRKNDGFMLFYKWCKSALISGLAAVKLTWKRDYDTENYEEVISVEQMELLQQDPNIEIKSIEEVETLDVESQPTYMYKVKYNQKLVKANEPEISLLPHDEFLFDPEATTQDNMTYAIHKRDVTADYLRRKGKEGVYDNIEEAIQTVDRDVGTIEQKQNPAQDGSYDNDADEARKKLTIKEYYGKIDVNDDGLLEDVIVTYAGNYILLVQENTFEEIPFAILAPILEPFEVAGKSFADLIGQIQNLKTLLGKEMAYNIAQSNNGRMFLNEDFVNIKDFLNNKKVIRTKGQVPLRDIANPVPYEQIHEATMPFLEYLDATKENRTGITRYNQGLSTDTLNKTATGINLIMQASSQRIELIARIFAETGFKRLFRMLIESNMKFIDQKQIIRLTNEELEINPDDLDGQFDLVVNSGMGISDKQEQVNNLQQMLQITSEVLLPMGVATPGHVYNIVKNLYEQMGFKNVDDFLMNPQQQQQMRMQQQMQGGQPQPQGQPQGGQPQQGQPPQRPPQQGSPQPQQGGQPSPEQIMAMIQQGGGQ